MDKFDCNKACKSVITDRKAVPKILAIFKEDAYETASK